MSDEKPRSQAVVVTGASQGIGKAFCLELAPQRPKLILAARDAVALEEVAEACREHGAETLVVPTDVADEASGKAAVAAALDGYGGLQGLVNCAGIVHGEKVVGRDGPHTLAGFVRAININLIGSFNLTRLAADSMAKSAPNAEGERVALSVD